VKMCAFFAGKRVFSSEQETVQDQGVTEIAPYTSRHFLPSVLARKTRLPPFPLRGSFYCVQFGFRRVPNLEISATGTRKLALSLLLLEKRGAICGSIATK